MPECNPNADYNRDTSSRWKPLTGKSDKQSMTAFEPLEAIEQA
jgi:hypothetical protein